MISDSLPTQVSSFEYLQIQILGVTYTLKA